MDASSWKRLFEAWPTDMPKRGIAITSWAEQIPFDGFLLSETFLLISRATPDSLGARMVILPFSHLTAVKLTDVLKPRSLKPLGFEAAIATR